MLVPVHLALLISLCWRFLCVVVERITEERFRIACPSGVVMVDRAPYLCTKYMHAQHSPVCYAQNHRMLGVGRDLCGSSSPTHLTKKGHLEQAAQDLVQVGLEYLQIGRLHNLPGQPVPVLRHPQSEEVLPHAPLLLP